MKFDELLEPWAKPHREEAVLTRVVGDPSAPSAVTERGGASRSEQVPPKPI